MRQTLSKLFLPVLVIPVLLLVSCSDDDAGATEAPTSAPQPPATAAVQSAASDGVVAGTVVVDFTGAPEEKQKLEAPFAVEPETTAWEAVKAALGEDNLKYQDYGGDLGIFISGLNGVDAEGNHFWEFRVNGETAEVGMSKYKVQPGDVLEFVYSPF